MGSSGEIQRPLASDNRRKVKDHRNRRASMLCQSSCLANDHIQKCHVSSPCMSGSKPDTVLVTHLEGEPFQCQCGGERQRIFPVARVRMSCPPAPKPAPSWGSQPPPCRNGLEGREIESTDTVGFATRSLPCAPCMNSDLCVRPTAMPVSYSKALRAARNSYKSSSA